MYRPVYRAASGWPVYRPVYRVYRPCTGVDDSNGETQLINLGSLVD